MSSKLVKLWPFILAIVAAIAGTIVTLLCEIGPLSKSLAVGTMTFGIVVAGFSATQRNMLLGMGGSKVLRFAARTGYHNDVLVYLMQCVYAGLLVSGVSIIGLFLGDNTTIWRIWLIALTSALVLVVGLIVRNERLIVRIVKHFMEDQHQNTK